MFKTPKSKPIGYDVRVIVSGNVVEVYKYPETIWRNLQSTSKRSAVTNVSVESLDDTLLGEKMDSRAKSNIRARNTLRRLALANFGSKSKFLTLTFEENMTDLDKANKEFKRFIRNIKRNLGDFKYIAVIEFQNRGAIHYHVLLDIEVYIPHEKLEKWWGNGFIRINSIDHVDNIGAYVIKYMTKEDADERLIGKKSYQCSKNLERPRELIGKNALEYIEKYIESRGIKKAYSNAYKSKFSDEDVLYAEYNFKRQF